LQVQRPAGRRELGVGPLEGAAGDDVVRHLLAGLFAAEGAGVRRLQADRLLLRCPLSVVVAARAWFAELVLPCTSIEVISSSLRLMKWSGLSASSCRPNSSIRPEIRSAENSRVNALAYDRRRIFFP
jgi:hypothetical protein